MAEDRKVEGVEKGAVYAVVILALTSMFSYLDRQILVLLVEPVRRDLAISDTEFSLLTGAAFAIFYTLMAVPMGIIADRWSRKRLIMAGVALWGAMTIACGFARSYGQMFVARMGVGLGEAALTPTAYSLVPDLFPPERRARAMSWFVLGTFMGSALSLAIGGLVIGRLDSVGDIRLPLVGTLRPWQLVFIVIGLATLAMLVPLAAMRDPPRLGSAAGAEPQSSQGLGEAFRWIRKNRAGYSSLFVGVPLSALIVYGMQAWLPAYFLRVHGWTASETGLRLGGATLVLGLTGALIGGWLADRWRMQGMPDAALRINAIVVLATVPVPLAVLVAPGPMSALAAAGCFFFLSSLAVPLAPTALQGVTPPHLRARVSALFLLIVNIVGIGLGPTAVAFATDTVFKDPTAVGRAIALVGTVSYAASAIVLWQGLGSYRRLLLGLEADAMVPASLAIAAKN